MEQLRYEYEARDLVRGRALVGVVGSGDLEVLVTPHEEMRTEFIVNTSVDGYAMTWKSVIDRFLAHFSGAARFVINDFGAAPGVVALRLAQAVEELQS
jgi:malonate decarboxylase delta subunit